MQGSRGHWATRDLSPSASSFDSHADCETDASAVGPFYLLNL